MIRLTSFRSLLVVLSLFVLSACSSTGGGPSSREPDTFNQDDTDVLVSTDPESDVAALIVTGKNEGAVIFQDPNDSITLDQVEPTTALFVLSDGSVSGLSFAPISAQLASTHSALTTSACFDAVTTSICDFGNKVRDAIVEALNRLPTIPPALKQPLIDALNNSGFDTADGSANLYFGEFALQCLKGGKSPTVERAVACLNALKRLLGKPTMEFEDGNGNEVVIDEPFDDSIEGLDGDNVSRVPRMGETRGGAPEALGVIGPVATFTIDPQGGYEVGDTILLNGEGSSDPMLPDEKIAYFRWEFYKPSDDRDGAPLTDGGQNGASSLFLAEPGTYDIKLIVASRLSHLRASTSMSIEVVGPAPPSTGTTSCTDTRSGICSELTANNNSEQKAAFQEACSGTFANSACAPGTYQCQNGQGTSNGTKVNLNVHWPASSCGLSLKGTCENVLNGTYVGSSPC